MKWLLTTTITTLLLMSGCASASESAQASVLANTADYEAPMLALASHPKPAPFIFTDKKGVTTENIILLAQQARLYQIKLNNTNKMTTVIGELKNRVHKTWYVFSGISPKYGWDCSGLVYWTYKQFGITLTHSASAEKHQGQIVKTPKPGDIVAFGWKGWSGAGHVGIYLAPDLMIHAGGKSGDRTAIVSISKWAKGNGNTKITYTRVVQTN